MGETSLLRTTHDESEQPARSARQDAKSKLAQVRAHHGFDGSDRTRKRQLTQVHPRPTCPLLMLWTAPPPGT
jgi:hypothetical protein